MKTIRQIITALRKAGHDDRSVVEELGTIVLKTYQNWYAGHDKPGRANEKLLRELAARRGVL